MLQYWVGIFWESLRGTFFTVWETPGGIAWSCLILILTIAWLWRKHGWSGMRSAFWATAGEGLFIASIAFALVFLWRFVNKPYEHWKAENDRTELLSQQKKSVEDELEKERDRSKPKFEISTGTLVISDAVITYPYAKEKHASVTIPVTVVNRGAPSVIRQIKLIAELTDGTKIDGGDPFVPTMQELTIHGPKGPLHYPVSASLVSTGTRNPIPTGGEADGWVMFNFRPELFGRMKEKGVTFVLRIWDVDKNISEAAIQMTGVSADDFSITPNMIQSK